MRQIGRLLLGGFHFEEGDLSAVLARKRERESMLFATGDLGERNDSEIMILNISFIILFIKLRFYVTNFEFILLISKGKGFHMFLKIIIFFYYYAFMF
jgi:hypothetical protein